MKRVNLGASGLRISPLVVGCMSFGDSTRGTHPWSLDEEASRTLIRSALDAGLTTFDTANMYSEGTSEEFVGRALADMARREDVVIATKVFFPMRGPGTGGLSRKAIMTEIDASLRRLRTDYVDLYQVHRWDGSTPIEETMEALHDVVKAGKVRYIGASSMRAWQFITAQHAAATHGWTPFISMQDQYNLVQREAENEMHPFCRHTGVGVIPWSPLARGRLTRDWDTKTERTETDQAIHSFSGPGADGQRAVAAVVAQVASEREVPRAQVALAWVRQQSVVSAPIVGVTKSSHLTDALASLELVLTDDELARLEAPYFTHEPGF